MRRVKTAVFVSGGGTNLQALLDADMPECDLCLVISRKPTAYALERAKQAGVCALCIEKRGDAFEQDALNALENAGIELVVLAGFLTILSAAFVKRFEGRILNIHPALLPAFGGRGFYGLHVHEAVLKSGVALTGATVHLVNETPDGGTVLEQKTVSVLPGDTPELLQKRVMEQAEWIILPKAVRTMCKQILTGTTQLACALGRTSYPGRGIVIGRSHDGEHAVILYFIMGRSENSRNRIFVQEGDSVFARAFDESKLTDPSLIIYAPIRVSGAHTVVTNGDQTDTVIDALESGGTFMDAMCKRTYEPDAPHYTPRISGMADIENGTFAATLCVLRRESVDDAATVRSMFRFDDIKPGCGYFIHTYEGDGSPLPSFKSEPEPVELPEDDLENRAWRALNADNRVSLCVRTVRIQDGKTQTTLINRNA